MQMAAILGPMKTDWFTKFALGIIALMLSVISLRPFLSTETVHAQATRPQSTATRQKWEYLVIFRTRDFPSKEANGGLLYFEAGDWTYWEVNGLALPNPVDINKVLNQAGQDGWELVTVEPISASATSGTGGGFSMAGATDNERWVFKRPK
jgi:hypothetical protein